MVTNIDECNSSILTNKIRIRTNAIVWEKRAYRPRPKNSAGMCVIKRSREWSELTKPVSLTGSTCAS